MIFKCDKCGHELSGADVLERARDRFSDDESMDASFELKSVYLVANDDLVTIKVSARCTECMGLMLPIRENRAGNVAASFEAEIAHRLDDNKTIFVNGISMSVPCRFIVYKGVARLAFPAASEDAFFTITWSSKGGDTGGVLTRDGDPVEVKDGMRFDVTETGN